MAEARSAQYRRGGSPPSAVEHGYPCPRQEDKWPEKQCAKILFSEPLRSALERAWPSLDLTALTTIAASIDFPSADATVRTMRHHLHRDVFPERPLSARGPEATAVIYLSQAPAGHPIDLSAPTIFPRVGVTVAPCSGSLLAWANVREDGEADEDAEHGVGPYAGVNLPPRVALHVPISFGSELSAPAKGGGSSATAATSHESHSGAADARAERTAHAHAEHVGCSTARPYYVEFHWQAMWKWRKLSSALRYHVSHTLMTKLRAVGWMSGKLLTLQQRAAERVYAPGGVGFSMAQQEFESMAGQPLPAHWEAGPAPRWGCG